MGYVDRELGNCISVCFVLYWLYGQGKWKQRKWAGQSSGRVVRRVGGQSGVASEHRHGTDAREHPVCLGNCDSDISEKRLVRCRAGTDRGT